VRTRQPFVGRRSALVGVPVRPAGAALDLGFEPMNFLSVGLSALVEDDRPEAQWAA
jgi:hypothetical protein